ncbi:MAG TPA: quinone-dependent dihydroorotate dehydrogenase [Caulobacteraceae bacterium]|nr:quinone-dependent dihydroorotate dehydrogenase [Caulobacteraceae bacterium]
MIHTLAAAALRRMDPEQAHGAAISALRLGLGPRDRTPDDPVLATRLGALILPNCVGLAAGFDKNAEVPDPMLAAGFGLVECGTVTPLAQAGNPQPRLFRLREDGAVINRLGFNNQGLDAFARRLAARPRRGVVGANVGANKESQDRIGDYVTGLRRLWPLADYFTANISSPNTPGLRDLQSGPALDELLSRIAEARAELTAGIGPRPLLLKVAPDLIDAQIEAICDAAARYGLDAVIVGNTTLSRPASLRSAFKDETGGLSGAPLMALSTEILRQFHAAARGRFALVGAGGIASGADAYAKIRAGASLVQLYSAMVYEGPSLAARIKRDLAARLKADGFAAVADATGAR